MISLEKQASTSSKKKPTPEMVAKVAEMLYEIDFGSDSSLASAGRAITEEYLVVAYESLSD